MTIEFFQTITVVDAVTGRVVAISATTFPNQIHWSADSKIFHVLSYVSTRGLAERVDNSGQPTLSNIYPQVEKVDFQALLAE